MTNTTWNKDFKSTAPHKAPFEISTKTWGRIGSAFITGCIALNFASSFDFSALTAPSFQQEATEMLNK